ncbi:protein disulfide-isomerase MPD1 precursor [Pleomassaria siparia CBS 279.74]|uniref:protein disulfide-isomerase n=1 Tax=Pleomassaria siparia CBS 279.74 TaxID=1314801 RepID=A0A6G1K463_9PLEO|nr:protein disulfide-isomerase MPD1 precursor [Pleomassaria siparia CBS 279.74]
MVRTAALVAAAAAMLLNDVHAESLYSKKSSVLQISGVDYDRLIAKSNYTSIVEFYAPWCGHCKNLKPAFESAAKSLAGIAKVAAVNCDEEMNKPFCGQMGVQGFPTLKIVRPTKRVGKPSVEDYQGQRDAKSIVEAVKDKIPNAVKRVTDKKLDEWLESAGDGAKAILFSEKGLVSATMKTLAVDFAGLISLAQIRNKEAASVQKFGIKKFPTLILLPAGSSEPIVYDGEMKKEPMVAFLSQVAPPNPDCPPAKAKKTKAKKDTKKESKSSSKLSKASASHKSANASSAAASATDETVEEPIKATESPAANLKDGDAPEPVALPVETPKPTIPVLVESSQLQASCLNVQSKTCILAIIPKDESSEAATSVLASLASIHHKHDKRGSQLFPFVGVSASNPLASSILSGLSLGKEDDVHLIATNGKRSWYKKYSGKNFGQTEVEKWVDALRMGEGKKEKLPDNLLAAAKKVEAKEEKKAEDDVKIEIEEIVDDTPKHGEL